MKNPDQFVTRACLVAALLLCVLLAFEKMSGGGPL